MEAIDDITLISLGGGVILWINVDDSYGQQMWATETPRDSYSVETINHMTLMFLN